MNGFDQFVAKHPQVWDNIEKDPSLNKTIKTAFIKHMNKFKKGNIEDLNKHAESFFHDKRYRFIGAKIDVKNEVLGRLEAKLALKERLTKINNGGSIKLNKDFLNQIFIGDKKKQLDVLKDFFGIEDIKKYVMWAFRNKNDKSAPYNNGILPTDLICVLGLEGIKTPVVKLAYRLPDNLANKPTALNASLNVAWRPGGNTIPLCKNGFPSACSGRHTPSGLPEVVHRPNTFNDIVMLEDL